MKNEFADRGSGACQLRSSPSSTGVTARPTSWSIGRKSDWSGSFAAPSPFDGGSSSDPTSGTASRTATATSARRGHRNSRSGAGNRSGGHRQPPDLRGLAAHRRRRALDDEERGEPHREEGGLGDRTARDRDRTGDGDELEQPRAPEVLAEAEELVVQLVDVERDEVLRLLPPRQLRRVRWRLRRGGKHGRDERERELEPRTPPTREREGDERREHEQAVRRLQRDREPDDDARSDDVASCSAVERAHDEDGRDQQQHHRREVTERREAQRLGQRLLVPAL